MAEGDKPIEAELVACEVCLKEVPKSEATVPEAVDYVAYFCGLDCHEKWKRQHAKPQGQSGKASS